MRPARRLEPRPLAEIEQHEQHFRDWLTVPESVTDAMPYGPELARIGLILIEIARILSPRRKPRPLEPKR